MRNQLIMIALVVVGCGGEAKKAIEQRRMAVGAKLAQVTALAARAQAIAPVTEGAITLGAAPLIMAFNQQTPLRTGTFVYLEDLGDLSEVKEVPPHYAMRIGQAQLLQSCGQLLAKGTYGQQTAPNVHANIAIEYLDACANLAYVFVLRTRDLVARAFSGDVVVFELATGKHLGGFPIQFTSEGRRDTLTNTTRRVSTQRLGSRRRTTVTTTISIGTVDADREQMKSDLADEVRETTLALVPTAKWLD